MSTYGYVESTGTFLYPSLIALRPCTRKSDRWVNTQLRHAYYTCKTVSFHVRSSREAGHLSHPSHVVSAQPQHSHVPHSRSHRVRTGNGSTRITPRIRFADTNQRIPSSYDVCLTRVTESTFHWWWHCGPERPVNLLHRLLFFSFRPKQLPCSFATSFSTPTHARLTLPLFSTRGSLIFHQRPLAAALRLELLFFSRVSLYGRIRNRKKPWRRTHGIGCPPPRSATSRFSDPDTVSTGGCCRSFTVLVSVSVPVCPICAARVAMDIVGHITVQHGNFVKISFFESHYLFLSSLMLLLVFCYSF
ncbi:hypothetical protein B296_00054398 [Ensete ventricosum]|uniref:Di19 zinc-binding domain-containing protein n=1 Tax=Ensete ventricosum TaxID=4639 RepID=A0A426XJ65_ENSVE|nr:hypothetical protein B296_00054398 [Ensete ventricosum]